MYRGLLLSGVAGVGKSTISDAIGRSLVAAGMVTAVVDVDALAHFGPPPHSESPLARRAFYDREQEAAGVEDFTVVNDRPATEVAHEILTRVAWISVR